MKIEIHGRQVEVDDSFKDMSEDEQHKVVDEIASGFMPTASEAAAAQETKEAQGPDVLPNIGAGAEAVGLRYGVGVPAVWGIDKLKKILGGADKALPAQPAPSPIPGEDRWFSSANAINEKAKIIRRNTELAKRYPGFERVLPPEPPIPLKEKIVSGLQGLRTKPAGKAFTSGYNLMDVAEHAGQGPLGDVQATASGLAAIAPYVEKYLPGKAKTIAKGLQLGTPVANYLIDKFAPAEEKKAKGGKVGALTELAQNLYSHLPRVDSIKSFPMGLASIKPNLVAQDAHLFHETNPSKLSDILRMDRQFDYNPLYVTNNADLAIGQGNNVGVKVKFRPNSLSGAENIKPGTGDLAGREYKTDVIAPQAISEIYFSDPSHVKQLSFPAKMNLKTGFDKIVNEDNTISFIRKTPQE
jgi:hypothetical protein